MKIQGFYGSWYDNVEVDGKTLLPYESQRVYNHSPDGFSWGYGGSGPAQLALAILLKAGIPKHFAIFFHQEFKWEFIAKLPQQQNFTLEVDVQAWVDEQLRRAADDAGQGASICNQGTELGGDLSDLDDE